MQLLDILSQAMQKNSSDVFIVPGAPPCVKIDGEVRELLHDKLLPDDTYSMIEQAYALPPARPLERLLQHGDDDFSVSVSGVGRFRVNAFKQRNSFALVLRVMSFTIPAPGDFLIPDEVMALTRFRKGMVLVTGPAGSGKSTTLACMIDRINSSFRDHIITIEDPLEFLHPHKMSIVSQRELEQDTDSYVAALRAALRQAPDVILIGEMRDFDTIQTAITAAETGQFVLSTLHTVGAAKTIDRIIDVFPANQQQQVRVQLSMVLKAVVSQQLMPSKEGGRTPSFEIMTVNSAIQNMIREGKTPQIDNAIYAGAAEGMRTMDADILRLYREDKVTREDALLYASNPDVLQKRMG